MFDIKESLVNKIFAAESFSKNFCSQNFLYHLSLLLLGAGIQCFDISISDTSILIV